jgi:predicted dienelactone hydrolase
MFCAAAVLAQTTLQLPLPSGPSLVGTTSFAVPRANATKPLIVTAWYPAGDSVPGSRARYLRDEVALRQMAALGRNPAANVLQFADVRTNAWLAAPLARSPNTFPVLLFSHGYLGLTSDYTFLMEDLASHGYIVFSIAHTGESMAVALPDGGAEVLMTAENRLSPLVQGVIGEWGAEDSIATAVTSATDASAALASLRWYLARVPNSSAAVARWASHMRTVFDTLVMLATPQSGSPFSGRLDLTRVGVFGHSMGGVASAAFCAKDARCRAAINLDGSPQYGDLIDQPSPRPFLMLYSARSGRIGFSDPIYEKGAQYWRAVLAGSLHLNFGDWQFWQGPARMTRALGEISPARSSEVVRHLVREFFDAQLSAKPAALLQRSVYPELALRRVR